MTVDRYGAEEACSAGSRHGRSGDGVTGLVHTTANARVTPATKNLRTYA
jgi:hypothetical protein